LSQKILKLQKNRHSNQGKPKKTPKRQNTNMSIIQFHQDIESKNCFNVKKWIKQYTKEDIWKILESQSLEKVAEIFFTHNINGKALLLLSKKDLGDMGINAVGELIVIKDVIRKLKKIDKSLKVF